MTVKISYMIHGTTEDSINGLFSGQHDIKLSKPQGEIESKSLGEKITHKFDVLFISDLKRSIQTAQLAFPHRCEIVQEPLLRECDYGRLNQTLKQDLVPFITTQFPNGESFLEVGYRVQKFLDFLKEHYDGKHIGIIGHQTPQLAIEVLINDKSWEQAIREDWRKTKNWKHREWIYELK